MIKLTQNQFYGDIKDIPKDLPKGSLFISIDSGEIFISEGDGLYHNLAESTSGAGFVLPESASQFADEAARDAWASTHRNELLRDTSIIQVGLTWELWRGSSNPPIYDPVEWLEVTPVIKGESGETGDSAYEIAVKDGFVGTISQWVDSLEGASAYEVATANGYSGTLIEWLDSLIGNSAYEVAVSDGFLGTRNEWLQSLIGKSAYDTWLDEGFVGTETDFIDSLKGPKGDPGLQTAYKGDITVDGINALTAGDIGDLYYIISGGTATQLVGGENAQEGDEVIIKVLFTGRPILGTDYDFHTETTITRNSPLLTSLRGGVMPPDHDPLASYSKGDKVYNTVNTKVYAAKQGLSPEPFEVTHWHELSIFASEARIDVLDDEQITQNDELERLRGDDIYPDYNPSNPGVYTAGTILHDSTGTGKNYRAKIDIPANDGVFDETNTTKWDQVSIESNNDPDSIKSRIVETGGNVAGYKTLREEVKRIATRDGVNNAQVFSFDQADEFIKALGIDASFKRTNGRIAPTFYDNGSSVTFWGGNHTDPTTDGAMIEFSFDTDVVPENLELLIHSGRSSSSGTRRVWVYDGDPSGAGSLMTPVYGDGDNSTGGTKVSKWPVTKNGNRIHVVMSRSFMLDFKFVNKVTDTVESLKVLTGDNKLPSSAISYIERFQTVYVSQSGDDTNDGRGVDSPVLTLAQANTVANTLPTTTNRVIVCLDGSAFTEDFTPGNNTHVYMPWAILTGDFTSGNLSLDEYTFAEMTGTVTVGKDDIINIGLLNGDIDFDNSTANQCVVNINIHQSGDVTIPAGAGGSIRMNINTVGTGTYTDNSGGSVSIRGYYGTRDLNDVVETQTIYVSNSGKANGLGRTPNEAVDTIAQAIVLAGALPITSKRIIKCIDASVFTEDIILLLPIDIEMPYATLTGGVRNSTMARCEVHLGAVVGNIIISNGSHYNIGQLVGNLTITTGATASPYIQIEDYNSGVFSDVGATGDVYFNIIHDSVGVVPTPATGYNPYGQIGNKSYQSNTGGTPGPQFHTWVDGTATMNGQWIDLITFDAITSGTKAAAFNVHFWGDSTTTGESFQTNIQGWTIQGIDADSAMRITSRVSTYDGPETIKYRIIRDSTDVNSKIRVQFFSSYVNPMEFTIVNNAPYNYDADTTFGAFDLYTVTGTESLIRELDVTDWQNNDIRSGNADAIATSGIIDLEARSAISFVNGFPVITSKGAQIAKFDNVGTRLNAGEYGSWITPTSTDWPIDALFWTDLIAQKRTTVDDTDLNPSSTITLSAIDAGGTNAATMTGFDPAHRGLRFTTTTGTRGIAITFANCLFQRIQFTMNFGTATSSGSTTQDYEIVDSSGNQLMSFDIPAANNEPGDINTFVYEFTSGSGDTTVYLRKRSTGTSQTVYLFNYGMTVNVDEPALEENVVLQQDSPLRGTLLPRVLPTSSISHPRGSMALNGLAGNRPMWHDGDEWAYINTTRITNNPVEGQFFFAEGNTFNDSGWTGSQHARLVPVQDHQGFPNLIRCTQSGGTITVQAPNNTQAFWDDCRANGFRSDFRMMFGATYDGQVWVDIECNNTSWGSTGRFEYNFTVTSGQLQITMVNSGGNTTFDLERDVMHTISMICPPNSDVAEMHVEGVKVGEVTYGGGGTTDRGTFFYIPPGNAVNDFSFQSITTYTLPSTGIDVVLDKTAIETGLRYNVPNVNVATNIRIPKGLYDFGNTLTIVNGSTEVATVSGLADDHQLIGGLSEYEVTPQKEVTMTQTSFPKGTTWAVEGGKTIINHQDNVSTGNSLYLTVDSAGTVTGRHGTYLGSLTVTRVTTGEYTITAGSKIWGNEMTILATPFGTAPREITAGTTLGSAFVNTFDAAGNPLSDAFYCSIYW